MRRGTWRALDMMQKEYGISIANAKTGVVEASHP
jgi:hypothetical protein